MTHYPSHPQVQEDLAALNLAASPTLTLRLARLNEFLRHVERVGQRLDYARLWPDRAKDEAAIADSRGIRPTTIYTWHREGFAVCLEERFTGARTDAQFRWLVCRRTSGDREAIAAAEQTAIERAKGG